MNTKKWLATLSVAALTVGLSGLVATSASAAIGDEIIVNGDFSDPTPTGSLVGGAATDFALAQLGVQGFEYAGPGDPLTSWDEGTYVVASNPNAQHVLWVNDPVDNPKMIVNGFTEGDHQIVWEQSNPGVVCPAGDFVTYDFSANVANILPLEAYDDGGAAISVYINGEFIDSIDLTTNDPSNVETLEGSLAPASTTVTLTIENSSTVKIGNDFSLDNISLVQTSGCLTPVTPEFLSPTLPTCDADGSLGVDLGTTSVDRDGYTLNISPAYAGPGTYTVTAVADADSVFPEGFDVDIEVTVHSEGYGLECAPPAVGGKTIGFWTNKNGTAAQAAGNLWAQVSASYPVQTGGLTFPQAQTFIKNATSSGTGVTMLRAQFFATALNSVYISGYGSQMFSTPIGCVSVNTYLQWVEDNWATIIASKSSTTAVKTVLDNINQDVPLVPLQCV
jgi:hypothetical protein